MSWSIAGSPRPDVCVHVGGGAGRAGGTSARRGLGRGCVPGASLGIRPRVMVLLCDEFVLVEYKTVRAAAAFVR